MHGQGFSIESSVKVISQQIHVTCMGYNSWMLRVLKSPGFSHSYQVEYTYDLRPLESLGKDYRTGWRAILSKWLSEWVHVASVLPGMRHFMAVWVSPVVQSNQSTCSWYSEFAFCKRLALFSSLLHLQVLITCNMQKWREAWGTSSYDPQHSWRHRF